MSVNKILNKTQQGILHDEYHDFIQMLLHTKEKTNLGHLEKFFQNLRQNHPEFNLFSDKQLSNQIIAARRVEGEDEWPNLSKWRDYISPFTKTLLMKAYNSCLLALEIYNKPLVKFRSEGYIVLMMIAWTSLFHAIFMKNSEKIQYKDSEENYFDLRKCIKKYTGIRNKEITANLHLLIDLRDRIVHRDNPIIDDRLFGYCQACLLNFQAVVKEYFNNRFQLQNGLAYSLQFSDKYKAEQLDAIKKYRNKSFYELSDFIKKYEDSLYKESPEIYGSQNYSFRVYLIPKPVKEKHAEASIEYVDYDYTNEEIKNNVQKVIFSIKETRVGGNYYKAGEVCQKVYNTLKDAMPSNWKFTPSYHHARCALYFKIREGYKTENPERTKKEYCLYDPTFEQYIYTQQWINFLIKKLKNKKIYEIIFKRKMI